MVRAFKSSRYGSTYTTTENNASCIVWKVGKRWMTHGRFAARPIRALHQTHADALEAVCSIVDPEQGGRYIYDNEPHIGRIEQAAA